MVRKTLLLAEKALIRLNPDGRIGDINHVYKLMKVDLARENFRWDEE
jgi:hypothetical protein